MHDPLWMLTRQWQLGEFEGEDSGSPIYVKVDNRQDKISRLSKMMIRYLITMIAFLLRHMLKEQDSKLQLMGSPGNTTEEEDKESQLDLQMQVRLGLQFQREIDTH